MKNMELINNILQAREEKSNIVKQYINDYQIITLKANIVGENKNIREAYILLSYFDKFISSYCIKKIVKESYDGPYILYLCDKSKSLKQEMVLIEEKEELGRFVDIDVYYNNTISLNRNNLRKCYLCEKPTFVCGRERNHTIDELNKYLKNNVLLFLKNTIHQLCDEAIMAELNLHPKFGLVTPLTNGSHKDMNYNLMIKAKEAIVPYFIKMFEETYNSNKSIKEIFENVRNIGIEAEQAMFLKTNGINAYKGLIFALGLVVTSVAIKLSNIKSNKTIFDCIKQMTLGITKELENGSDTYGKIAFKKYEFRGARYEAENGFPSVINVLNNYDLNNDFSKLKALCYLITNIEDTVLLKRCKSIEKYNEVINKFKNLNFTNEEINSLNDYCINNNLSFGGAADLLIVSVFIKEFENIFNYNLFY